MRACALRRAGTHACAAALVGAVDAHATFTSCGESDDESPTSHARTARACCALLVRGAVSACTGPSSVAPRRLASPSVHVRRRDARFRAARGVHCGVVRRARGARGRATRAAAARSGRRKQKAAATDATCSRHTC
jgi:hypothetical protein